MIVARGPDKSNSAYAIPTVVVVVMVVVVVVSVVIMVIVMVAIVIVVARCPDETNEERFWFRMNILNLNGVSTCGRSSGGNECCQEGEMESE